MRMGRDTQRCASPECPPPCTPECRRMTCIHPLSASPSRLAPVRGPGASRVCSTLLWYTASVPIGTGDARRARSVLCLPMQTWRVMDMWLNRTQMSRSAATRSTQHPPDRLIGRTAITCKVTERLPLLDPLEYGCPHGGRDLPAKPSSDSSCSTTL
jgi:hypothetical protein